MVINLCLAVPEGAQGVSLVRLSSGAAAGGDAGYAYAEAAPGKWMARSGGWKLIAAGGRYELFDLAGDSGETRDLAAAKPSHEE